MKISNINNCKKKNYVPSFIYVKIITEVDVPELQLLASNLKPEECVKLVSLGSNCK